MIDDKGCCLAKIFISNIISYATRSKRKGNAAEEDRRIPVGGGGDSCSARKGSAGCHGETHTMKKVSSEIGICEYIDDDMLGSFTMLPSGMDRNEWLATHTLSLFEAANALCGTLSELCTPVSCPIMCYPGVNKAYWIDERRKNHPYSAMQYIDCVMSFCEKSSKDQCLYPTKYGGSFSCHFEPHCRRILQLLWHCCGHLYSNHWEHLSALKLRPQFSLVLAHMHSIAKTYDLMDSKDLSVISQTLQLIRPAVIHRYSCGHQAAHDVTDVNKWSPVPSSKSGSWGGHPSSSAIAYKPHAQTC